MSDFEKSRADRARGHWTQSGDPVARITKQLAAAKDPVIKFYPGQDPDGKPELFVQIFDRAADGTLTACGGVENATHWCPPDCE